MKWFMYQVYCQNNTIKVTSRQTVLLTYLLVSFHSTFAVAVYLLC